MLSLTHIKKNYELGDTVVEALKDITINFRSSEFVSILGPSGCGKTTLLNIIGGLDRYTSGELRIGGRPTESFNDRDWDAYRNHSIGFVFQSYNLIPHQTVLQNVELALTLSGVSKAERRRRASEALEQVGLGNQLNKRPSEMSGGQMQRVAIARAIVNDPEIILADEPTGALDTETSVQVMDILKKISEDRLIIMVTHNPELAEKYSTRIIRMLDGVITDDSAPLSDDELNVERAAEVKANEEGKTKGKKKLPSMSFATSFGLSLKNLFTKKGRTLLTSFAGSIGIIGIALIFAVSQGTTNFINSKQEEMLSSYPLMLESRHVDIGTLLETFVGAAKSEDTHEKDAVYQKEMLYELINSLNTIEETENDLASFKVYLEERLADENDKSGLKDAVTGVQYGYGLNLMVYTKSVDGTIIHSDTSALMKAMIANYLSYSGMGSGSGSGSMASLMNSGSSYALWDEMLPGENGRLISDVFDDLYDVVYGSWPTEYNEVVLILDENNELDEMSLYALGLISQDDVDAIMTAAVNKTNIEPAHHKWSYEEICSMEYKAVFPADCYSYDEATGLYTDLRSTDAGIRYLYSNGTPLKITGIIRMKDSASTSMLKGSIAYTTKLTEYIIEQSKSSESIKAQLADPTTDIFSGLLFKDTEGRLTDAQKNEYLKKYLAGLDEAGKAEAYLKIMSIPSEEFIRSSVDSVLSSLTRDDMEKAIISSLTEQMGMSEDAVQKYVESMSDDDLRTVFSDAIKEQVKASYAAGVAEKLASMPVSQLSAMLDAAIPAFTDESGAIYYNELLSFSSSSYEDNMRRLAYIDLDKPTSISLFASTFEDKDTIEDAIAAYNDSVEDLHKLSYTDYIGIILSSITTIINAITYVLIAFVAISLIVSSIMIGVITLISVQERTKEIGILRAIGASKKNVSSMFNAETVIIGFTSGFLGILVTYLLCIPINLILHALTDIPNLSAQLPILVAISLVLISMLLTLISGIIPSRSAAKKDPVVALRTE